MNTLHENKGNCNQVDFPLNLVIVTIKLIAPSIELAPAKCREKIAKSTLGPL
jgi:hypothetical protein